MVSRFFSSRAKIRSVRSISNGSMTPPILRRISTVGARPGPSTVREISSPSPEIDSSRATMPGNSTLRRTITRMSSVCG